MDLQTPPSPPAAPDRPAASRRRRPPRRRVSSGHALMAVAFVLAALANLVYLRGADRGTAVLVAARDLPAGTVLTPDAVTTVTTASTLPGLLASDHLVTGQVLLHAVGRGEPIVRSGLRPATGDGLRAMSIPIDPAHAVGGDLRVGDRVDVIEVRDTDARYIAVGIEVTAVSDPAAGALGAIGGRSVTVAVDDVTALRIAAAIRADAIELVRSTGAPAPTTSELSAED